MERCKRYKAEKGTGISKQGEELEGEGGYKGKLGEGDLCLLGNTRAS